MTILNKINKLFPNINWNWYNYTSYPRIRFYFNYKECDLEKLLINLEEIFNFIFLLSSEKYLLLQLYWNKRLSNKTLKSLKLRWIYKLLLNSEENQVHEYEWSKWFLYFSSLDSFDISRINKSIIEKDFSIEPILYLNAFYFDFNKQVSINLYDDRWMDIISTEDNKIFLDEIYNKFKDNFIVKYENII